MRRLRTLTTLPLALALGLTFTACNDDPSGPSGFLGDLEPFEVQEVLYSSLDVFSYATQPNRFLAAALQDLDSFGIEYEGDATAAALDASGLLGLGRVPGLAPKVVIPDEYQGATFVFNGNTWEVDEEAPALSHDGIRITWYGTEGTGFPIISQVFGYIDVMDLDGGGLNRLGIRVILTVDDESTQLADYTVGYAQTSTGEGTTEQFEAAGFVRRDTAQLDFTLAGATTEYAATGGYHSDIGVTMDGPLGLFTYDVVQDQPTGDDVVTQLFDMEVIRSGVSTEVDLEVEVGSAAEDGSGTVKHGGSLVANVTTRGNDLSFTSPDGSLTGTERNALESMVGDMIFAGYALLSGVPFLLGL